MLVKQIKSLLYDNININHLEIQDETYKHANHKQSNGGHFKIVIISNDFRDVSLINRHKMIYNALSTLIGKEIHAISISARTVDE